MRSEDRDYWRVPLFAKRSHQILRRKETFLHPSHPLYANAPASPSKKKSPACSPPRHDPAPFVPVSCLHFNVVFHMHVVSCPFFLSAARCNDRVNGKKARDTVPISRARCPRATGRHRAPVDKKRYFHKPICSADLRKASPISHPAGNTVTKPLSPQADLLCGPP